MTAGIVAPCPVNSSRAVIRFPYSEMANADKGEVTLLLDRLSSGDRSAESQLFQHVYLELHRIAERCMSAERAGHTLQPTVLVNEAYMRLCRRDPISWESRAHFFALAARVMRRILTDYARHHRAAKRGTGRSFVELELLGDGDWSSQSDADRILAIDQLLERFAEVSPRAAQVVEMRFFVGMTEEEIGAVLAVSSRTIKRDWLMARAWLHEQLAGNR